MKKIINTYKQYEHFANYRAPEFTSNASEFHVMLWNLNFKDSLIEKITPNVSPLSQKFVKDNREIFTKEFVKTSRQIYKLISQNPLDQCSTDG